MLRMRRLLVTGGCGFIGSTFVRHLLRADPDVTVINFDALTYAGNLANLADLASDPRHRFVRGDITDRDAVRAAARRLAPWPIVGWLLWACASCRVRKSHRAASPWYFSPPPATKRRRWS